MPNTNQNMTNMQVWKIQFESNQEKLKNYKKTLNNVYLDM